MRQLIESLKEKNDEKTTRFHVGIAAISLLKLMPAHAKTTRPKIEVFKSPTCGCCTGWVEHLRANGFDVTVNETVDPGDIRKRVGLPSRYASCHNGIVGGYIVEGHVPAAEVSRLLALKPKAIGLAVAGMPAGSPGMEMGDRRDPYEVLTIDGAGRSAVFARYRHP